MGLILAIFAVPLIEIALFVTLGAWLGLGLTLTVVVGTAMAGVLVLRHQGAVALADLRRAAELRRDPLGPMAGRALVVVAGFLLILPGFMTDTLGLLLLLPVVRGILLRSLAARFQVVSGAGPAKARQQGADVIDAEYHDLPESSAPLDPPDRPGSGWTRH